jgi:hypothetical protein
MKLKQIVYSIIIFSILIILTFFSLTSLKEKTNICGQTMDEANNPVNWHNGVYSPVGCDIIIK